MNLPHGTVTFLFTDIEGSTRLWERYPEPMRVALASHDALLRATIESNGGHVFKTIGDAFCAAFSTPMDALHAAMAAQLGLHASLSNEPVQIKVRMALHTGAAELRDADYFGPPLNRVARLLAVGHGGQTLLSQTVYDLVRDALPADVSLVALGEHRLKDLTRPETIFQAQHPALPSSFPPLRSLNTGELPNNLPHLLTSFIGRSREIAQVSELLHQTRLLTLLGAGGCGKTRLALQVAAELLERYPDGVWLIELAALTDASLVPHALAHVLDLREERTKPIKQTLIEHLKSGRILLILDNCEHLVGACADLAADLLRACPQVTVLATSREALNVAGETTVPILPLTVPDPSQPVTLATITLCESVQLFIERATALNPGFAVTDQNAPALAQICSRLDGIPLALELAAARTRSLSIENINNRLDQCFRLLTGGSRTALPRQQTLQALIDWSYDLLNPQERLLLHRLAAFVGGWSLEAAEAICAGVAPDGEGIEEWEVLDILTGLVDKSLALYQERNGVAGYRMLETMRQYAGEKLARTGEAAAVRNRHCDHFLRLATEAASHLNGPDQATWLECLEMEHDNLRAALGWSLHSPDASSQTDRVALRLVSALWQFWRTRGYLSEGRTWSLAALKTDSSADDVRAGALNAAGAMAFHLGDFASMRAHYEESLGIVQTRGDQKAIAYALDNLGSAALAQGDPVAARSYLEQGLSILRQIGDRQGAAIALLLMGNIAFATDLGAARIHYEEALALAREFGDQHNIAILLNNLGVIAQLQDEFATASDYHQQSLAIKRSLQDRPGIAFSLGNLGDIALYQGDLATARSYMEESLSIRREIGDRHAMTYSLMGLGSVAYSEGDAVGARTWRQQSLRIYRELGDRSGIADALEALANVAAMAPVDNANLAAPTNANARHAARLWGAAGILREALGVVQTAREQHQREQAMAAVRQVLNDAEWETCQAEGRAMPLEQAISNALQE